MQRMILVWILVVTAGIALQAETPKGDAVKLSDDEKEMLRLTNGERKKEGLEPLKPNVKLFAAARSHCANMAKQDKLDHTLDDRTFVDRIKTEGYRFGHAGENIAWNQKTPQEAVESWMRSPGHKANLLGKEYTEVGLAVAKNAKGERYWVQVFARPLE